MSVGEAIVFALVWTRFVRRGPLEQLLHLATAPAARLGRRDEREPGRRSR
jgi:uncharacterized membrane protein YeiB